MKIYAYIVTVELLVIMSGCAAFQKSVIQGSVVMRTESEGHINLGSSDGIAVGDTMIVYRDTNPSGTVGRHVRVGSVRVVKILDTHYAAVEIISGSAQEKDEVEKVQR